MTDWPAPSAERFSFGPFRFFPARQLLLEGATPVRLGNRALEILVALVERPGELVSRDELVALVWPNTIVEESNLKVNVAALRRALGEGRLGLRYIATVSGRGYRFVAPVELSEQGSSPALRNTAPAYPHNLPVALTRAIGRADTIDALLKQLPPQRKAWVPLGDSRWPRCDRCCARMDQQPRGILVLGGVAAHQRRALPPAGVGSGRGGSLLAGTRIGPSPERTAVGIARGHEPSPALHQNDGPTRLKNCYLQSTAGLPRALRRQIS